MLGVAWHHIAPSDTQTGSTGHTTTQAVLASVVGQGAITLAYNVWEWIESRMGLGNVRVMLVVLCFHYLFALGGYWSWAHPLPGGRAHSLFWMDSRL